MKQSVRYIAYILLLLFCTQCWGKFIGKKESEIPLPIFQDSLDWADYYFNIHRYQRAIPLYQKNLDKPKKEKVRIIKKLALSEAALGHPTESVDYIYEYLLLDFQPSFLLHEDFDPIRETHEFNSVSNKVIPKIGIWPLVYFFVALVGFYIMGTLLLNQRIDKQARLLIVLFVFIHSFFILNISINQANYLFELPHSYLMSTWSSFLYGPLLYFYFKRVSTKYQFTWEDAWHLLPTLALCIYLIPNVYAFPGTEKINLMLSRLQNGLSPGDSGKLILLVALKALSLAIYAFFIHLLLKKRGESNVLTSKAKVWQNNIYYIHVAYVITYIIYGVSISTGNPYPIFLHAPIIMMAAMVLYLGYVANVQPHIFSGVYTYTNRLFPKYVKSGLTESLSLELKNQLALLFEEEKLYRRNDINLDMVAKELNTTRHNASQIINEHFKMSFHEFINQFRIKEAKELLENNDSINIIDIAYEVGYNNKVTFNKAFKKETQLTPSQYVMDLKSQIRR